MNFIKDRSFYKNLLAITIPIALQSLIGFSVSLFDTIMVGKLGEVPLSACSLGNQPQFIFGVVTFGLASGGSVLISQYWGKKDMESIRHVMAIVLRLAIAVSIAITVLVLGFPRMVMSFYSNEEAIITEGVKYLRIVGFSYIFTGIASTCMCVIRSVEIVKISVIVSLISCVVNIFFNWLLISGNLGAPALGIEGAAIGTLLARMVEFLIITVFMLIVDKRVKFKVKCLFKRNKALLSDSIKYSLPVLINESAWAIGISVQSAVIGKLEKDAEAAEAALSAISVAGVLQQLATIVIFGVANAACVIVGKKIGEGKRDEARASANTIMIMSIFTGIIAFCVVFFSRKLFVSVYGGLSPSTAELTENVLIITSFVTLFMSESAIGIVGVLRGAGDSRFAMRLELIVLWLIALPAGVIAGFGFGAPMLVTYAFLKIDEPIKVIVAFWRTMQEKTYRNITR